MAKARKKPQTFKFTRLEVHLIYGFRAKPKKGWDAWFSSRLLNGKPRRRAGWTPMYRYQGGPSAVLQYDDFIDGQPMGPVDLLPPNTWKHLKQEHSRVVPVMLSITATVRRDGVGALTLTLTADARPDTLYDIRDLLATMLIAPRTLCGMTSDENDDPEGELAYLAEELAVPETITSKMGPALKRSIEQGQQCFSSAFTLYLGGMAAMLEHTGGRLGWPVDKELELTEFSKSATSGQKSKEAGKESESKPVRILDTQVPYTYVFASTPYQLYKNAFLEEGGDFEKKRQVRKDYTNEIAAILGRWLVVENIPFTSTDYWEAQGLVKEGAFRSLYMNSLVFTTFSKMAAFSLHPDMRTAPDNLQFDKIAMCIPFEPTRQSILRCLEFSRARWHHVISLNRKLDELIEEIVNRRSVSDVLPLRKDIVKLRSQAAIHFEDPLAYLWDATVGSEIAKFLHASIIERLEESTIRKLEMLDKLIEDRVDILKIRDFLNLLKTRTPITDDS